MSEDLDLVVINPWNETAYGPLSDVVAVEPPLWARLIASVAMEAGYSVRVIDAEAERKPAHQVAMDAFAYRARLVVIAAYGHQPSASTQQMDAAYRAARGVRTGSPSKILLVGGHVSALPVQTLRECPEADFVCMGEGPETVLALLRNTPLREVPGILFRDPDREGRFVGTHAAPLIEDLGRLGGVLGWSKLLMDKYRAHNWQCLGQPERQQEKYASIYTSLGCPYACEFCCINAPFGVRRYRMRSPEQVVAEVWHLWKKHGVRTLKITDEMFVLNPKHYLAICDGLAALEIPDLNIWAYARVDTVREGHLARLRAGGIQWLALGIESADPSVRDGAEKHLRRDDIAEVVREIQAAGIHVIANYIFGLPGDTQSSMRATLDMAMSLDTEWANFYSATAYPGSPLYSRAAEEGWTLPPHWGAYAQHAYDFVPSVPPGGITPKEVLLFRDMAHHAFFSNPEFITRTTMRFGIAAAQHVLNTQTTPLRRRILEAQPDAVSV